MTSRLRAQLAAPPDDGALMVELSTAVKGVSEQRPTMLLGIANRAGQVYREITVHGPQQYRAVRECFVRRGYRIRPGDELLIARFERVPVEAYEPVVGAWDDD
jgi:hypothetical protein